MAAFMALISSSLLLGPQPRLPQEDFITGRLAVLEAVRSDSVYVEGDLTMLFQKTSIGFEKASR
jgi:hypothetical protein